MFLGKVLPSDFDLQGYNPGGQVADSAQELVETCDVVLSLGLPGEDVASFLPIFFSMHGFASSEGDRFQFWIHFF